MAKAASTAENEVKKEEKPVKAATKKPVKASCTIQYQGMNIVWDDVFKAAKKAWAKEYRKKQADLKSIDVYIKPEERAAYYVANKTDDGKIDL